MRNLTTCDPTRIITHYDSLNQMEEGDKVFTTTSKYVKHVEMFVKEDMRRKHYHHKLPPFQHKYPEVPQQENGYDCGVFLCAFAYCVVHDLPIEKFLEQKHMQLFRKHMLLSVTSGTLVGVQIEYDVGR